MGVKPKKLVLATGYALYLGGAASAVYIIL
jgi:hypothetical protein